MDENKEEIEGLIKTCSMRFFPPPVIRHIPKKYPRTMTFKRFEPLTVALTDTTPIELFKEKLPVKNFETEMEDLNKFYEEKEKKLRQSHKELLNVVVFYMKKFIEVYDLEKENKTKLLGLKMKIDGQSCPNRDWEDEE